MALDEDLAALPLVELPPIAPDREPDAPLPRRPARRDGGDPLADFFFDAETESPPTPGLSEAVRQAQASREYLTFSLGREEYAVEIDQVREVLKAPAITEVPRAPPHVLGVIMVRGDVIPVFDPRRRLGLASAAPARGARVVVCDAGDGPVGLLVDGVSDVLRLRASDVEPRPNGVGRAGGEYVTGIGREGARMVILLDVPAVLRSAPAPEARR